MEEGFGYNSGYKSNQNGHLDSTQTSAHLSDPVKPSLFDDSSFLSHTSRQSSVDSLVLGSDWSDTSFYTLPTVKKVKLPIHTAAESSHVDTNTDNPPRGHKSCLFQKGFQQQNVSLSKPQHPRFHITNKPRKPHPIHHQHPIKTMNRSNSDISDNHASADSDDTIGRSSSGIASDLESPRSYRSSFVETPRGVAWSIEKERQYVPKEPVGARSLDLERSKTTAQLFSESFHNVPSNVDNDSLLLGHVYADTGFPRNRSLYDNTGIPSRNGSLQNKTGIPQQRTPINNSKVLSRSGSFQNKGISQRGSFRFNTGTPQHNGSLHKDAGNLRGSFQSNTGTPIQQILTSSGHKDTGIPQHNGSLHKDTENPQRGSFQNNTGTPQHILTSNGSLYTGIPQGNVLSNGSYTTNVYDYTGIPHRKARGDDSFVNMYSSTRILKQYDKISAKNLNEREPGRNLVLNNGVKTSELEDSWTRRKIFAMNNSNQWKHVGLLNSFTLEPPQHVSSSVWAMKLLESETTPTVNPQLLLKARLFRRWHQRARLQRLDRMEYENKMNKAVEFWRNNTIQKHFGAWKRNKIDQMSKADKIYQRHMLETGLKSLQFAVQVSSHASSDVRKRMDSRVLAKFWLKWQSQLAKKKSENLRSAFNRWRMFHLSGNRDKILEGIADKHIMTKSYIKWKMRYSVEQNNSIAKLNFQISLITKCWHSWRIYAAQRIVKTRTNEVARIHYENHLQTNMFKVWLERRKRCSVASNLLKRRIVVKAFYLWRNWTQYAKVIHQRFQSMCKEYYNRALLKQSFVKWKQKLMLQQAINYHSNLLQKRVYRLWFLRYRRNVIHRHLCKAMAKKGKKRCFFKKWQEATHSQREKRQMFIGIFHKLLLSKMMLKWKYHTDINISLKQRFEFLMHKKDVKRTRLGLDKWLFAMKVANFKKQVKINWTKRCVKNACIEWKLLLKRKALEQTLIETRPARDLWLMRAFWSKWKRRKETVDREQEHVRSVAAILMRNFKRRIFIAWRVTNQQEQIISPTVARRERKLLAKVFDGWRLHIYRQKYIIDQHTRANDKLMDKHFLYWKEKAFLQIKGRNAATRLQFSKLSRAFIAWRGYIREIRHDRLKQRAEKLQILSLYFKKWTERFEEQVEAKEKTRGLKARNVLLVRWVFKYWKHAAESKRQQLLAIEEQVKSKIKELKLRRCMDIWLRWFRAADIVRTHQATRQQQLIRKVFLAWSGVIKDELNAQLNRFSNNLALDCSLGSASASQLFRSGTLDSNGGSFLRSTLDSTMGSPLRSTMDSSLSDYLSSGYWTTRRGSGSVFTFRNPGVSQRDDDVASLPGRFDPIHGPDSPRFRSASPITLIRESNNVVQATPALGTGQSPNSTPSPSPPELHLSLASSTELTDSVFSQVKERGSFSLRHEFERRQSSMDEEEMFDSMSMASGFSTASVRDKELVVIDTIRHWLHLSLSKTFRSWLKYTRQKKLLRELLYFAKEKKSQQIISQTFKQWRRELYITVASRQFWLNTTKMRCLRAWHSYVEHRQLREKSFKSAETLNRNILLKRFFITWRTKYTAKMRLQTIVGQWQKKAIVTEKHKAIGEKIQSQHSQRDLRQRFRYWVLMTRKSQEAKQFYLERLLPRMFIAWHQYSCTHANNCKKSTWFKDQRVLSMAFREWKKRFEAQHKAHEFVETKEIELSIEILKTWHEWATGVCARRRLWRSYHKSLQVKTMKSIFTAWVGQVKRRESAEKMFKHSLMRSVLLAWKEVCHSAKQNKDKAATLKNTCESLLLKQSFNFWHKLFVHSQLATNHAQQQDSELLKECFKDWREFTLTTKADKHHVKCILKKTYYQWYDKCHARKKARQLIRSWKNIAEDSKVLNSKAMEVCQLTDKKNLRQAFMTWMQATHKIQKAKHHYAVTTCRSSLNAWFSYAHTKVCCRKILSHVEAAKSKALLLESFSTWKDSFERQVINQEILDDHLQAKQEQLLQSCMIRWRKYTLRCRSQKHHDERLVSKSFFEWRLRHSQKKGLQKVMEKVFYRRIRQAAVHWKQWTIKTKRQQSQADEFQINVGDSLVKASFAYWVIATERSRRAKLHHEGIVKKRILAVWKVVIRDKIKERKKIEKFQMEVMGKKFFLEWRIKFEERLAEKDIEQVKEEKAIRHYHFHLSRLCFRSWYHDVRVEKHLEMKQQLLVEKHFRLWQKKASLKSIASVLGDQQMYAKYWSKWRNQLVRKRVAELMMKHEEKKLLSEVFGAWYKMTMIERRLLGEWNVAVTEKWFRRWMQKYNES